MLACEFAFLRHVGTEIDGSVYCFLAFFSSDVPVASTTGVCTDDILHTIFLSQTPPLVRTKETKFDVDRLVHAFKQTQFVNKYFLRCISIIRSWLFPLGECKHVKIKVNSNNGVHSK